MVLVCMCATVTRKQRVETYLDPELVEQVAELARQRKVSSSKVIREATRKELQRDEMALNDE